MSYIKLMICEILKETPKALLVRYYHFNEETQMIDWVPRSQVETEEFNEKQLSEEEKATWYHRLNAAKQLKEAYGHELVNVTMPQWLWEKKRGSTAGQPKQNNKQSYSPRRTTML